MRFASIRHVTYSMLNLTTDNIHGNIAERHYFTADKKFAQTSQQVTRLFHCDLHVTVSAKTTERPKHQ